jgi:hypothetical protein
LLLLVAPAPVQAVELIVDTLADVADPPFDADDLCGTGTAAELPGADGQTSLREAIIAANRAEGPDEIRFAPSLAGGTLSVGFDDLDADTNPDTLPFLWVGPSFAGIGVAGGGSGPASDNRVEVVVEGNAACSGSIADIQCAGGFAGTLGVRANEGTGNRVTARLAGNLAERIVVEDGVPGNAASVIEEGNAPCLNGDATCNGRVTAADVTALHLLIADEARAMCRLDDATPNGVLDAADIAATIRAIFI